MAELVPFATKEQLAAFWRTLTTDEAARADILLVLASNRLRLIAGDEGTNLQTLYDAGDPFASTLRWVVMEAVKRALQAPQDMAPVESYSQTAGPYSENYKYTNPTGDLWFKKVELSAIGLSGKQTLNSISSVPSESIYS